MRFFHTYRRLFCYLRPHRPRFAFALVSMVLYGVTDGAVPFLIRSVLDDVFGKQQISMLYWLSGVLLAFAFVRGIFNFYQHYLTSSVGHRIVRDLRNAIDLHLLNLSPSFFSKNPSGSLIARVTNDTLLVRSALTDAIAAILRDTVRIVSLLAAALYLDPLLGAIAFLGFPLALWPIVAFGRKVRRLSKVGQEQLGGLTSLLHESVVGHKVVQAFGMEGYEFERFRAENDRVTRTYEKAEKYGSLSAPTNEIFASLAISAVIWYGGTMVFRGMRSQGDFVAFLTALFLLYEPIKKLSRVNTIIQQGLAAADRIFEFLDTPSEVTEIAGAKDLVVDRPKIVFEQVGFRYNIGLRNADEILNGSILPEQPPAKEEDLAIKTAPRLWAVRDVNFSVEAGETLALVGSSGGGKSTIANLLLRFYDPEEGRIMIAGQDISQVTLQSLRRSISLVGQHTFLFNDTIYNNIAYGKPGASPSEVQAAARAAFAESFISRFPQGYDTNVGEHGSSLSGGERSRIAIARALIKDSPILILDEATAALDSESEELVQAAIERLMVGRTVVVIAHRLATIRGANKVAVLAGGQVVEIGTHAELLANNGEFAKLYRLQFGNETVVEAA